MCVGVMGTALASPLYPLYQAAWNLRASDITHVFVVYMFGVLVTLLFMGRLIARFGFLANLRLGLALMTAGVLLSAAAGNVPVFMAARLVIGVASGMISTSAATGLVQVGAGRDPRRVSAVTTVAMTLGFGMGPLVGGLIAQWMPWPLVTAYVPSIAMGVLAVRALLRLRDASQAPAAPGPRAAGLRAAVAEWLPRIALPPRHARRHFWIASLGAFSAFGMFSLYASLAPSFMRELVPWHGPAVSGSTIAAILFLSSAFQFLVRNWRTKVVVVAGGLSLAACNLLLAWTTASRTPLLFAASVLVTSFGHALANVAGMSVIGKLTHPAQRAGLLASYMVVGYLGTIVPILAVGWLADHLGLSRAVACFSYAMAALSGGLALLASRTRELPPFTPA
ncbi:MFS transporter [Ramlibacter sp. USB13]|uniref:MFS transporter n=1 Tax=Ramlibacter cellulosilyticus TaxID=2764187 RepID=A0A923MQD9_9BURK|nr:MFS transporter [Ramlibacter cellulosilyticus]MBC5782269.1 MFS transporter [Ramlibacter cellulosilyticus]